MTRTWTEEDMAHLKRRFKQKQESWASRYDEIKKAFREVRGEYENGRALLKAYEEVFIQLAGSTSGPLHNRHPLPFADIHARLISQLETLREECNRLKSRSPAPTAHVESPIRSGLIEAQLKIKSDLITEQKEEISRLTGRITDLQKAREESEQKSKSLEHKLKKLSFGCRALVAM